MDKASVKKCFFTGIILFSLVITVKGEESYQFSIYNPDMGFPSKVNSVFPEDHGYLWIGSSDGLYRYDGNECIKISDKEVTCVCGDSGNNIWYSSNDGLVIYDKTHDSFSNIPVSCICTKGSGSGFYASTDTSIIRYDFCTDSYAVIADFSDSPFRVFDFYELPDRRLICASYWQGIRIINPDDGSYVSVFNLEGEHISSLFLDSHGRVWIGLYNKGIECIGLDGEERGTYSSHNSKLSNDVVISMTECNGRIWAATDGGGVNIIRPIDGNVTVLKNRVGDSNSIPYDSILSLTKDSFGNIWAIRIRGCLFSIREQSSYTFNAVPSERYGLSANSILCLCEDRDQRRLWIGTDGGGVNIFDQNTYEFRWIKSTEGMKIVDLADFSDEKLLLSVFSEGLFLVNKNNGSISRLPFANEFISNQIMYTGNAVNLQREQSGNILILSRRVFRYNTFSGEWNRINIGTELSSQPVAVKNCGDRSLFYDWNHVYGLYYDSDVAEIIFDVPSGCKIRSVSLSGSEILWISTDEGVYYLDMNDGDLVKLKTDFFETAKAIAADNEYAWIATETSVFRCESITGSIFTYVSFHNVSPSEYHPKSSLVSSKGVVYIGGMDGILVIDKNVPPPLKKQEDIVLSEVLVDNEKCHGVFMGDDIRTKSSAKSISMSVFDRARDLFLHREFLFRTNGGDVVKQRSPSFVIRNLHHGKYEIDVAIISERGTQSEWKRVLNIIVPTPWYKSRVFIVVVIFLFFAMILFWTSRAYHAENKQLKHEISHMRQRSEDDQFLMKLHYFVQMNIGILTWI